MVDHKGGKRIVVRLGAETFTLGKSASNGKFSGSIHLSEANLAVLRNEPLPLRAVLPRQDPRRIAGEVGFMDDNGVTVISDIDDTIKITQIGDRNAILRNTFLEPFRPVPGMPEVYRAWADKTQAQFTYVSASPWQLFLPLSEFVRSNGFPAGTFCLKDFRLKDKNFWSLFQNPEKYKPTVIEPLVKRFPNRRFVLVGDSGERDPEIYAALARRFPTQVIRIFIRDVTNEPASSGRYERAFHDLPPARWKVFRDPPEILNALEPSPN
jgi:phosphatidate phosphatase APP1